eukprot:CAMPEP_0173149274 /NCGR_PEP_ID=MMETSP1105-20130129/10229_1 /TAXON_ID=2985 /ORGANISM="Ochromonas sp., Strain BG-1" /LENGTH=327 /DNA_ID=CAMNT_0014064111 /DNA_START=213 /DNA_END=1196 /DNA_ORIENTATION=-
MGLDVQTLDHQVAEKQRMKQSEKETDKFERLQAIEIERILAEADEEEKQMKKFQMDQIKQSWELTLTQQKAQNKVLDDRIDFDENNCGPAAALRFAGEDTFRADRHRQQKDQMRRWIQEQVAEKAQLRHLQKREEMNYADMIKAIDEIRLQTEEEEKRLRKYIDDSVKEQNRDLATMQRERNKTYNRAIEDPGVPLATTLYLHDEDKTQAYDANGRIIRRDMFKGFTDEQRKRLLYDNQFVAEQKRLERLQDKQKEYDWAVQQVLALRAMEEAEYEEKQLRETMNQDRLQFLSSQMESQRKERDEWNKTKFGTIEGGFFEGFGKSHR